jgi:hypothetical protein
MQRAEAAQMESPQGPGVESETDGTSVRLQLPAIAPALIESAT